MATRRRSPGYFKSAITRELNARGYKLVEENPELLINFNTNARENVDIRSTADEHHGDTAMATVTTAIAAACMPRARSTTARKLKPFATSMGTANIDVVDAAKKQLVWEGIAEGKITDKMMKNPQATIDGVITEMFLNYPVKAGGVAP